MPHTDLSGAHWVKSSHSTDGGNCVEWAPTARPGTVPVRDSKDPEGPVLLFTTGSFAAFVTALKSGRFEGS
ncbi:DUF397 domain-containing protein [Kitasatospora sp. NA04385]|uniref:DUF397 domain-containing protein n=1 Tax=Kitasatospora sp. NA04385 TaxID=2742135 RepID=UPI001591C79D|nr:DUF397 domain-containing protein [Kitasatospora sp. NA04385]QKW20708.1 DUF397 domain-containing protein [Kitasatospora sp. NA04385]